MLLRIVLALALLLTGGAQAQMNSFFPGPGTAHSVGAAAPTIDGFATNSGGVATQTISLTNAQTNDVVVVFVQVNDTTVASVSGSVRGAYAFRNSKNSGGVTTMYEYWVAAPTATTETITITYAGSATFSIATAFAVHGLSSTAAPFDSNGSLPASGVSAAATNLATTGNNTMVISAAGAFPATAETGWTDIEIQDFWIVRYKTFPSAQSSFFVPYSGTANPVLSDALLGP